MRASLIALMIFALTLGLKLNGGHGYREDYLPSARAARTALEEQGFLVTSKPGVPEHLWANRQGCTMVVRLLDSHGTYEPFVRAKHGTSRSARYLWAGEWNARLPRFGPLVEFYMAREWAQQGYSARVDRFGWCWHRRAARFPSQALQFNRSS